MLSEVSCLSLAAVPPGEQRSRFLAVGLSDSTVRIISLDPTVSVCLCVCVSVCLSVSLSVCMCVYVCFCVCLFISLCCMHVCVGMLYVYLYVHMFVCVYVCMVTWVIRYVTCIHVRGRLCLVCVFKSVGRCGCIWYNDTMAFYHSSLYSLPGLSSATQHAGPAN